LENGRIIVMEGEAKGLARERGTSGVLYLGLSGEGRKSFRDVKHYRRRKRWLSWTTGDRGAMRRCSRTCVQQHAASARALPRTRFRRRLPSMGGR